MEPQEKISGSGINESPENSEKTICIQIPEGWMEESNGQAAICRECLNHLSNEQAKLEEARDWSPGDSEAYEALESYCLALHSVLETLQYYKERESILAGIVGEEKLHEADMAWYRQKTSAIRERLGI